MNNPYLDFLNSIYPSDVLNKEIFSPYLSRLIGMIDFNNHRFLRDLDNRVNYVSEIRSLPSSPRMRLHLVKMLMFDPIYIEGVRVIQEEDIMRRRAGIVEYTMPQAFKDAITLAYSRAGYDLTYFGFMRSKDPHVLIYKARKGAQNGYPATLAPSFYQNGSIVLSNESSTNFLSNIKSEGSTVAFQDERKRVSPSRVRPYNRDTRTNMEGFYDLAGIGWSKKDIVNAIIATGLTERVPGNTKRMKLDDLLELPMILDNRNSTRTRRNHLAGFGVQKKHTLYIPTKGTGADNFYWKYYMPKLYYEIIYKKILSLPSGYLNDRRSLPVIESSRPSSYQPQLSSPQPPSYQSPYQPPYQPSYSPRLPRSLQRTRREPLEESFSSLTVSQGNRSRERSILQRTINNLCNKIVLNDEVSRKAHLFDVIALASSLGIMNLFPTNLSNLTPEMACQILNSYLSLIPKE